MTDKKPTFKRPGYPSDQDGVNFDFDHVLESVVSVRTTIPDSALTAAHLGTERAGHGVVINDEGLVLTIGYVVTEAETVWIVNNQGNAFSGHVIGYDQQSGFGLVQAFAKLDVDPMPLGNSASLSVGQSMLLAGAGGESQCLEVQITELREFAGYWEYLLESAIFTSPVHPSWGGAALIDLDGRLCGIGSLILQPVSASADADNDTARRSEANMVIPIDLLPPILDDLLRLGKRRELARPWMGWFTQETERGLVIADLSDNGPAANAGIRRGDFIREIDGVAVDELASMYRLVWNAGEAGVAIQVTVERAAGQRFFEVTSIDRNSQLFSGQVH